MPRNSDNPFSALKRIFHEPNRLSIMSVLCNAIEGATFNQLKEECELTDGNLSSHLKMLEEACIIYIEKTFVGSKPQTKVFLTDSGRESFISYLKALEMVLIKAAESVSTEEKKYFSIFSWLKPVEI